MEPREEPSEETAAATEHSLGTADEMGKDVRVCMRTLQSGQWRSLMDTLKDPCPECPVSFKKDGMRLVSTDPTHVVLIHLHALSEFYYCRDAETTIGLNITQLYRMLRNLTTGGYVLQFMLTDLDPDHFIITVTNAAKQTCTVNRLKLRYLGSESIEIPATVFNRVLSIPSTDLQRHVRELTSISSSKRLKLRSTRNILTLSAEGVDGDISTDIKPTAGGMKWSHIQRTADGDDDVVEGVYPARYLERFCKPLVDCVQLFIKVGYPLVLKYTMQTAVIRFAISPIMDDGEGAECLFGDDD